MRWPWKKDEQETDPVDETAAKERRQQDKKEQEAVRAKQWDIRKKIAKAGEEAFRRATNR
jgi:hypothetical protein